MASVNAAVAKIDHDARTCMHACACVRDCQVREHDLQARDCSTQHRPTRARLQSPCTCAAAACAQRRSGSIQAASISAPLAGLPVRPLQPLQPSPARVHSVHLGHCAQSTMTTSREEASCPLPLVLSTFELALAGSPAESSELALSWRVGRVGGLNALLVGWWLIGGGAGMLVPAAVEGARRAAGVVCCVLCVVSAAQARATPWRQACTRRATAGGRAGQVSARGGPDGPGGGVRTMPTTARPALLAARQHTAMVCLMGSLRNDSIK